jgi:hypothetical protein
MRVKHKKYTDYEINQYCQGVEKLLGSINERIATKKSKKRVDVEEEDNVVIAD